MIVAIEHTTTKRKIKGDIVLSKRASTFLFIDIHVVTYLHKCMTPDRCYKNTLECYTLHMLGTFSSWAGWVLCSARWSAREGIEPGSSVQQAGALSTGSCRGRTLFINLIFSREVQRVLCGFLYVWGYSVRYVFIPVYRNKLNIEIVFAREVTFVFNSPILFRDTETKFLGVIGTKVLRVVLLAIHNHLY